jgi:hypothetical protein
MFCLSGVRVSEREIETRHTARAYTRERTGTPPAPRPRRGADDGDAEPQPDRRS